MHKIFIKCFSQDIELAQLKPEMGQSFFANQKYSTFFFRNLLFLKYYDGDVSDLELDFSVVNNDLGETKVMIRSNYSLIMNTQLSQHM